MTPVDPPGRDDAAADAARWLAECDSMITDAGHRVAFRRRGHGPVVLLLHGFPTWSYDYAAVARLLEVDHTVVTLDFLGYGASDKPRHLAYSVPGSADVVEELATHLGLGTVHLVTHDYGAIVGQELLLRRSRGALTFDVATLSIFNSGIVYRAYRPTRIQRILALPLIGPVVASRITAAKVRSGLDAVRGSSTLTDDEFANLWVGIARDRGPALAHRLVGYNAERVAHHLAWETALREWDRPLHLLWGLQDPVSGPHVLDLARHELPEATVTTFADAGHFPMSEAPDRAAAALRRGF